MSSTVIASPPRWIVRTLLGISALLGLAILTVRTPGIIATAQLSAAQGRSAAATAFAQPAQPVNAPHALDSVAWTGHPAMPYRSGTPVRIPLGTGLRLTGWALEPTTSAPFAGVYGRIDGSATLSSAGIAQLERLDVAAALTKPSAKLAGFSIDLDTTTLPLGRHSIDLRGVNSGGTLTYAFESMLPLIVTERVASGKTLDAIDAINGVLLEHQGAQVSPIRLQRSYKSITLTGWGFFAAGPALAKGVSLLIDSSPVAIGRYGLLRPDVATVFHDVRLSRSGFELTVPANLLSAGRHVLSTRFDAGNGAYAESRANVVVVIE